ncbi:hypothetical protein QOZ80_3AG0245600 [Eleusine coracana subsp. coracana]|nr:hypothetical protein QOZ80_3AG0245600 [Eleusine coracana subsp. coracana]
MERQRSASSSSTSYHLMSPKGLLLLSFASSSLLFSFLFALFAIRQGRPLHVPFDSSPLGANLSAEIAQPPVRGGSADGKAVEAAEAVLGRGIGDSVAEEGRGVVGGYLPDRGLGSAIEVNEVVTGGGNAGGAPTSGEVSEGQDIAEAGNYSLGGLDSAMRVNQEVAHGVRAGEKLVNDSRLEKTNLAEGKNSKGYVDSTAVALSNVINVSTSHDAAATGEKLEGTDSRRPINFSMEASGSLRDADGEFIQSGRLGESGSGSGSASVQEVYASEQEVQLEISDHSAVKNNSGASPDSPSPDKQDSNLIEEAAAKKMDLPRSSASHCDVYDGSWVFDDSYPFYTSDSCPFIDEGFSCEANGRTDRSYMKWRWQPKHCNIPRFDARKMLEMLQGKRLVFVGDSLNRNQWESMMCLLRTAISDPSRIRETRGRRITKEKGNYNFKFLDYNCSVEYHVTHFLVHEGKARIDQKRAKTLRIDTIDRGSSRWKDADVLVFNTAHWWSHHKTKAGVNYYQEGDHVHRHLDASTAFQRALTTWASWVDRYINPRRTQVFFRSSSPSHFSGGEWNSGGHCRESTHPLNDTRVRPMPERNVIVEQVTKQMKTHVSILNITYLSGLRIDGHPSVYGRNAVDLTASSVQDCSQWCLPGVPDTWNELLFYHLVSSQDKNVTS